MSYFQRLRAAFCSRASLLLVVALCGWCWISSAHAQGVGPHFGMGSLIGDDVGLDDGYARFGAFVPLWHAQENVLVFSDTHLLLYNERSQLLGANLGGGVRYYDCCRNRIFGGYAYYDFRDREVADFDQIGFGFETLGYLVDGRVNINLPMETDAQLIGGEVLAAPVFGGPAGQNIVVGSQFFQQAMRTVDVEAGVFLKGNEFVQVRGYIGGYGLYADDVSELGARGRVELRAHDQFWVSGYVQNDDVFGTTGGVTVEWRFGRKCDAESSYCCVAQRMGDPVQRRNYVALHETHEDILATVAGQPITVLHVSSNANAGGMGGIDDPLAVLDDASNQPHEIVFLHGDSVFTGESIVITTPGQRLLGEGVPHLVMSDQGDFLLPGANPAGAAPQIVGSPGNAVTFLAVNVEVSGLVISGAGVNGISGGDSGFSINRNSITQSGVGINIVANGPGEIVDNVASDNQLGGIGVVGGMTGNISRNTANGNGVGGGILVTGIIEGNVDDNITSENEGNGILINGAVFGLVEGNVANQNDEHGIFINGDVFGGINGNTANNNDEGGIGVEDNVVGGIAGNTANNNGAVNNLTLSGIGIGVDGEVLGNVSGNTANGNAEGGILVTLDVFGDVSENTANDNMLTNGDGHGIRIGLEVDGSVVDNDASSNAGSGISIGSVTGALSLNDAQENDASGIIILGDVGGAVMENGASLNGAFGLAIFGDIGGSVERNTTNDNDEGGLFVDGNVNGDLFRNTAHGNEFNGIFVVGNVDGDVRSNFTDFNVQDNGVQILGNVTGSLLANFASDNGIDGVHVRLHVNGNVLGNATNDNGDDGIEVGGDIDGTVGGNVANGNGGQPLNN